MKKFVVSLAILCTAAGCVATVEDTIVNRSENFLDMTNAAVAYPATSDFDMKTSGTADFVGHGVIITSVPGSGYELVALGVANLNADFGNMTLSGSATDFVGGDYNDDFGTLNGSINLSSGMIGGTNASDVTAHFSGNLSGMGYDITTSGTMIGSFHGYSAEYLLMANDTTPNTTINGGPQFLDFVIVAED